MTSPISGITSALSSLGSTSGLGSTTGLGDTTGTSAAAGTSSSGNDFASVLANSLDQLQSTQSTADGLAVQAATGNSTDIAQYMIAANEASLATQTVVTLKNQAVNAFNSIMGMQV